MSSGQRWLATAAATVLTAALLTTEPAAAGPVNAQAPTLAPITLTDIAENDVNYEAAEEEEEDEE